MKQQIASETKIFASNGIDYMEILIAHNGVEVWAAHSGHYKETEFDQIMADWKRQEEARKEIINQQFWSLYSVIERR